MRTVVKLYTLGSFCFRGKLGFMNCDDIYMCVVNKQFELISFVFVDLKLLSLLLLGLCACLVMW